MANNKSFAAGGFMFWSRPLSGTTNLKFVNNVFYKNRTQTPPAGSLITGQRHGSINEDLAGSFIFVNNTSIMNNTGADEKKADQDAVNLTDFGGNFDVIFVNNIMLDRMTEPFTADGSSVQQVGWGWTIREVGARSQGTYIVQNNLIDGIGGGYDSSWGRGFMYSFKEGATANNNKDLSGQSTEAKLSYSGIARVLSTPSNAVTPCIEIINSGGYVVDAGVSSLTYNGEELIPQTDIRGNSISGVKDLGAFEFGDVSTGLEQQQRNKPYAYYNAASDAIEFEEEVAAAKVYTVSGVCVASATNTYFIDAGNFAKGIYILVCIAKDWNIHSHKIIK